MRKDGKGWKPTAWEERERRRALKQTLVDRGLVTKRRRRRKEK